MSTQYEYDGDKLIVEYWNGNILYYVYDQSGSIAGMRYRKSSYPASQFDEYLFEKNLQGDVVAVYDINGTKLVSYTYDAWGNFETTYHNGGGSTSARYNPFRYRGYYYDSNIGLYYLNTRYYSPELGRFISADSYVSTGQGLIGYNMYAYCNNNPVMYVDPCGDFPWLVLVLVETVICVASVSGCSQPKKDNKYNSIKNEKEKINGKINYTIIPETENSAAILRIYDSHNISSRSKKSEILEYIINTEEAKNAGLKYGDISYYIQEWNVHNVAYKYPDIVAIFLKGNVNDIIKSAEHVDLNTDDPRREKYKKWGDICGWLD